MKKTFAQIAILCPFLCPALFTMATLSACGDDGSNEKSPVFLSEIAEDEDVVSEFPDKDENKGKEATNDDTDSLNKGADIPSGKYVDSTLFGEKFDSSIGTLDIVKGTVYDSTNSREYKTVKIGPYVWMTENLEFGKIDFDNYDMCYDGNEKNCKSDGRLFRNMVKKSMCPEGFDIPSADDYRYLMKVTDNITKESFGFAPQMAGYCQENESSKESVLCEQKGKSANLLTNDNSVFTLAANGDANIKSVNPYRYYSLRCMKLTSFVEDEKKLPICNEQSVNTLDYFYVASKGINYICDGTQWVKDKGKKCTWSDISEKRYYRDTLFVCKNGLWSYADLTNIDLECTSEMAGNAYDLNGVKYVCNQNKWAEISDIEIALGICSPKNLGTIDSILNRGTYIVYVCLKSGWKIPQTVEEIGGVCDSTRYYKTATLRGIHYTCRTSNSWEQTNYYENQSGICTPNKLGVMDTIENNHIIICDTSGWRGTKVEDFYGVCDSSRYYEVVATNSGRYACRTDDTWKILSAIEKHIGVCTPQREGVIDTAEVSSIKKKYICENGDWRETTVSDYIGECTEEIKGVIKEYGVAPYICDSTWRKATKDEYLGDCTKELEGEVRTYGNYNYICTNLKWEIKYR